MRLVFWQNMLSPHQLPYISKLLDDERIDEVVIVAPEKIGGQRQNMGWETDNYVGLDRCRILINPEDNSVDSLFKKDPAKSWHLFSGIHANQSVFIWLSKSMKYNLHRGMITEGPNTYDFKLNIPNAKPLWMHRIRFLLEDRKYANEMDVVFAMGIKAVNYFKSVNSAWHVFPFSYCTQSPVLEPEYHDKVVFTFTGSMEPWKDPISILYAYMRMDKKDKVRQIMYIGAGSLLKSAQSYTIRKKLENKVTFLGVQSHKNIPFILNKSEVLILPSRYDGWGAVVNEALQSGCYVIVSDGCGASDLVRKDNRLGRIFKQGNVKQLAQAMDYCASHLDEIKNDRQFRVNWSEHHISGNAMAKYMVDCLSQIL